MLLLSLDQLEVQIGHEARRVFHKVDMARCRGIQIEGRIIVGHLHLHIEGQLRLGAEAVKL